MARYEIRDADTGETFRGDTAPDRARSTHGSAWQLDPDRQVKIILTLSNGEQRPVLDGYWYPGDSVET